MHCVGQSLKVPKDNCYIKYYNDIKGLFGNSKNKHLFNHLELISDQDRHAMCLVIWVSFLSRIQVVRVIFVGVATDLVKDELKENMSNKMKEMHPIGVTS